MDLSTIPHVNTRGIAEYSIALPPQEIGIYFETDWHEHNIVVKSFRKNSYASTQTDIQIGDVLIAVDDEPVSGPEFERAMSLLKERLRGGGPGCVVRLQTVEEKMRLIRGVASNPTIIATNENARNNRYSAALSSYAGARFSASLNQAPLRIDSTDMQSQTSALLDDDRPDLFDELPYPEELLMRVEIRQCEASSLILMHHAEEKDSDYRIYNQSLHHVIIYKQKGIPGNRWRILKPGQAANYHWDDPFKIHKLLVRVTDNLLCPSPREVDQDLIGFFSDITDNLVAPITYIAGTQNDSNTVIVNFDEIGRKGLLPIPQSSLSLGVEITSVGPAKTLNIFHPGPAYIISREILYTRRMVSEQVKEIRKIIDKFADLSLQEEKKELSIEMEYMKNNMLTHMKRVQTSTLEAYNRETLQSIHHAHNSAGSPNTLHNTLQSTLHNIPEMPTIVDLVKDPLSLRPDDYFTNVIPFDCALGDYDISTSHKLLVQVLEAKDLKPFVAGKLEDVYCRVYLKIKSITE